MIVGAVLCTTALVATALIISIDSNKHYDQQRHNGQRRSALTDQTAALIPQAEPYNASWN